MIEVVRLSRRFGQHLAVDDVSFQLEKGEVVGFLGPNGAGKTTTMRVLTGFLPATSAERLRVAGFDVLRQSLEARKHIGYLPESVPLYRELRVREMLLFQGRLHGMARADLKRSVPDALEQRLGDSTEDCPMLRQQLDRLLVAFRENRRDFLVDLLRLLLAVLTPLDEVPAEEDVVVVVTVGKPDRSSRLMP